MLFTMGPDEKISSIYQKHTKGCNCWPSRSLVSRLFMKIHAYGGANLVPIAVLEIYCCFVLLPNSKLLLLSTNTAIFNNSSADNGFLNPFIQSFPQCSQTHFRYCTWVWTHICWHQNGIETRLWIFLMRSPESLM